MLSNQIFELTFLIKMNLNVKIAAGLTKRCLQILMVPQMISKVPHGLFLPASLNWSRSSSPCFLDGLVRGVGLSGHQVAGQHGPRPPTTHCTVNTHCLQETHRSRPTQPLKDWDAEVLKGNVAVSTKSRKMEQNNKVNWGNSGRVGNSRQSNSAYKTNESYMLDILIFCKEEPEIRVLLCKV